MKCQSWIAAIATVASLYISGTRAQTEIPDLGTLLAGQKNLTTFYGLIQKYPNILLSLPSTNGVTILAPNNDAFDKIPYSELKSAFEKNDQDLITNILQYHILTGPRTAAQLNPGDSTFIPTLLTSPAWTSVKGGQRVENIKQNGDVVIFVSGRGTHTTVTQKDLMFTGGVIQVLDSLLIPPANLTDTFAAFNLTAYEGALYQTKKTDPYTKTANSTFFVPDNDAFQALGPAISDMTTEQLAAVLDYHTIPGQVIYSTSLTNGSVFTTAQGGNITVRQAGNTLYINSAPLGATDILLKNGVLHVLQNVLNPAGPGATPNPQIGEQGEVFASASKAQSLPFTSAIPCTSACPTTSTSASMSGSGGVTAGGSRPTSTGKGAAGAMSSSKALGVAMARETGFGAAGLMVALGGAVMMI
ncbi:hypothetical protein HYALB_00008049 [Hymenoscyphus albidus]|uniref:FAS1 domain-containing protein n=1 Tax=Hymenoscyphus albidus TaxID=595503 RepID=A0A9N9LJS1_9HELO|nr:hypothetical protein HYALB_00008049 [Hymenoscyphus albidus]